MAPTHSDMGYIEFKKDLKILKKLEPEVVFWEPINARGSNGKRMVEAGLAFAKSVMTHKSWAQCFIKQWVDVEKAAEDIDILDSLHIWPDRELVNSVPQSILDYWWYRPTSENWLGLNQCANSNVLRPRLSQMLEEKL